MFVDQTTDAVWDQIRATRWNPPIDAAVTTERRATYVFALEQAEQMFRAAATVGTATRPLLVFYGLSQAGRAIAAAAASAVVSGDRWKLKGHGIRSVRLEQDLPTVEVHTGNPGENGSFVRLSELLESPVWGKAPVRLNELWDLLPENEQSPLLDTGYLRRTPLWIEHRNLYPERHRLASVPVVRFPPWLVTADDKRESLNEYMKAFPAAQGYIEFRRADGVPDADPAFDVHQDGWAELLMHWQLPAGKTGTPTERVDLLKAITRSYGGRLYFFPVIAPNDRDLHPLMAWWAVLHTLSMLARYQPAEWASHIDVDTSQHAVAIERVLKQAIQILPQLIVETIDQVSGRAR